MKNLEEIRGLLGTSAPEDVEQKLRMELEEAASIVSADRAQGVYASIQQTSEWLAERELIRGGARRAIEIEWEVRKEQKKLEYPEVKIQQVDDDAYRKAPDFPRAYFLEFVLDRVPNSDWIQVFMAGFRGSFYNMKRETHIVRDRIVMVVADSDNLQWHADFAKRLVEETNQHIRTFGFQQIDQWCEGEKRAALQQFDAIQSLKARTKEIKL